MHLYSSFNLGARWEVGGQRHAPAALPPGKDPVPIVKESGWAPRADLDGCGKFLPHRDSISGPSSHIKILGAQQGDTRRIPH